MRRSGLVYLTLACAGLAVPLAAQSLRFLSQAVVVPGVRYQHLTVPQASWSVSVNVVAVDLRQSGLSIQAAHAEDKLRGRETVSAISQRKTTDTTVVIAAVNADFFNLETGESENNQVVEGEILKGLKMTDASADKSLRVHSQFGITGDCRPLMEQFVFHGTMIRASGARVELDGINHRTRPSDVVLYTSRTGASVPWDSTGTAMDIRRHYVAHRRDTSVYQVVSFPVAGGTAQFADGPILSMPVGAENAREVPRPGELIRIQTNLQPAPVGLRTVVGGWPRLVVHGRSITDTVDRVEGTFPKAFLARNPRTGIGFSRDSATLYLVTVDGRQEGSDGMTLGEFADLMISLGIYEGLNLDGGGSTAMVINGKLVNTPAEKNTAGQPVERTVGNALLVVVNRRD